MHPNKPHPQNGAFDSNFVGVLTVASSTQEMKFEGISLARHAKECH